MNRVRKWLAALEAQLRFDDDASIVATVPCKMLGRLRGDAVQGDEEEEKGVKDLTSVRMCKMTNYEQRTDELKSLMKLVPPAMKAATKRGTKMQRSSLFRYWAMYCATYSISVDDLGQQPRGLQEAAREAIRKEAYKRAGFASFIFMSQPKAKEEQNSVANVARAVGAARNF